MKFLPYIIHNVTRNKLRTIFTSLSIGVSLFLVTLLYAFINVQDELANSTVVNNRLVVTHSQGLTFPVPIAYLDRVRQMSGVKAAAQLSWFGGHYKEERSQFAQFGTDPLTILQVLDEYTIPEDQLKAWQDDRTGCVVGSVIARGRGWKIGDKIPLKGDIYDCNLDLTVRGIYDGPDKSDLEMLWFDWKYLDELLREKGDRQGGNAGTIMIKATSAEALAPLMRAIDERFASSDSPTRTMTEKAFQQMFTEMVGNVQAYIRNTSLAVVFSLVCVAANAMALSLRERTREVAVLKAIGFSRTLILIMVLSEAVFIAVCGGLLGVFGAKAMFALIREMPNLPLPGVRQFYVPWMTVLYGMAISAMVGLMSGIVPAWRAAQVSVVDGLRKVI